MPKCKHCKKNIKKAEPIQYIPLGQVHKSCMDDFINKTIIANKIKKQKRTKEMKQYKKQAKRKRSLATTQDLFNTYIRWRDTRPDDICMCISCGMAIKWKSNNIHAGHYYSRGARSDLRYNEDNVHAQCAKCNMYGEASKVGPTYKKNLIKKIGKKRFNALKKTHKVDYSEKALKEMRTKYNKLMKE